MQFKYIAAALLSASAVMASPAELQRRQDTDLGDIITSAVVEGATSVFGEATSAIGDAGDAVTSKGAEIGDSITSRAADAGSVIGSLGTKATSAIGAEITEADDDGAALGSFQPQQALLVGAATVMGSALLGSFIAL